MHAINLGLLFACNGGALHLGTFKCQSLGPQRGDPNFQLPNAITCDTTRGQGPARAVPGVLLRLLLCEDLLFFGGGAFDQQLDRAYANFLGFCRARRIPHSQPPFIPRMAAWSLRVGRWDWVDHGWSK